MKPLLSYYGGKQRIGSKILQYFPPHKIYVEPFAGGATLLFLKPLPTVTNQDDYKECINDTSNLLINLYRVAKKYPIELNNEIQATLYSQSEHNKAKIICKNPAKYSDIELAWAYYINITQGFSHQLNTGWSTSKIGQSQVATFIAKKARLSEALERLEKVHISCEDAIKCIERWDSPDTLFYCDPPYPGSTQGHYSGYTIKDWTKLCHTLDCITGNYIVSNYHQMIEPQSFTQKIEINTVMSASHKKDVKKKRTEVLWVKSNLDGFNQLPELINSEAYNCLLNTWGQPKP
ncbi:DNA adenine methylase [Limnospira platensis CENA597]|uniref:DNA adenine methylase n=2 Tax=Limnospira platensis TaxID=118562 RepID=UPI003DA0339F